MLTFVAKPIGESPPTVSDVMRIAKSRLPTFIWKYISYTSGEGRTMNDISDAFSRWVLKPRILGGRYYDVKKSGPSALVKTGSRRENVSTRITLFGRELNAPLVIAPTAFHGLYCRGGEAATAYGASRAGVAYCYNFGLSNVGARDVNIASERGLNENTSGHTTPTQAGIRWAHVYVWKDRRYVLWTLREAERLKFDAIIVTADHPHDRVKGDTMPIFDPHENEDVYVTPPNVSMSGRPNYRDMQLGRTLKDVMTFPNRATYLKSTNKTTANGSAGENDGSLTFDDLAWICRNTTLPVICKGVLTSDDALLAVHAGCRGVCVSNHGGRQLDRAQPAIDALPRIVSALRDNDLDDIVVLVDSGFRTGSHVLTGLALGAHAVLIGRPTLWGLAASGAEGVQYVFERLALELRFDMKSVGVHSVDELRGASKSGSPVLERLS